jgi:hypothetical protein
MLRWDQRCVGGGEAELAGVAESWRTPAMT